MREMITMPRTLLLLPCFLVCLYTATGQEVPVPIFAGKKSLRLSGVRVSEQTHPLPGGTPLFSAVVNGRTLYSHSATPDQSLSDSMRYRLEGLEVVVSTPEKGDTYTRFYIRFHNPSPKDTLVLENVVPLGSSPQHPYLSGLGKHGLSRAHLFLPGRAPVNVILPDNAWELGYASLPLDAQTQLCALARRREWNDKARRRRFETQLLPGGSVGYQLWVETVRGDWQEGLRRMFQERYLYDLEGKLFDDSLYRRADQQWIRHAYAMHLIMGWDRDFYDPDTRQYRLQAFLQRMKPLLGGTDVVGIWPNWPMLGLDQRNQWDLLRDLPGGLPALREQAENSRRLGARFFISYNPWDESTRWEDHHTGMSEMIREIGADGVVLDTEGKSSPERQQAADRARPGVIMYSEGMAVPKDMPGILSGRVHNALYYPPLLNLNKLIRPDFAIFRVAELFKEPIRREFALSLFNGYGTEINQFQPGRPDWLDEQYAYWGRILMAQRENSSHFHQFNFTPLYPSLRDSVYVNAWPKGEKTVFTLFSRLPGGFTGPLFYVPAQADAHVVDLWNHLEVPVQAVEGRWAISVDLEGFSSKWLGTNNEGAAGILAVLPKVLEVHRDGDLLHFSARRGDEVRVWAGDPCYAKSPVRFSTGRQSIRIYDHFGAYEGKMIVQVFEHGELLDERVIPVPAGSARRISPPERTAAAEKTPTGMVSIPDGRFLFRVTYGDNFIPHPDHYPKDSVEVPGFYMDKYPVTNAQFLTFLQQSGYRPADTSNFLRHWHAGKIPIGQEQHPVVFIHYEDALAYCRWAGKRLPSELEWQYAAQTADGRDWPWSKEARVGRESQVITNTLTVSRLKVDSTLCNSGNGKLAPVGSYPGGANPFGLEDLVGSVWQLTHDVYANGANTFHILKGGSYYLPANSWWYVEGGPRELTYSQKLLRISPGFERNGTIGFRCVQDKAH